MHEKDLRALLTYLKENSSHFPVEVLRGQMVKAGHPPGDAEQAIGVFEGRIAPPELPAWPGVVWVVVVYFALAGLVSFLFPRLERGAGCSFVALLPGIYFLEFISGLLLLASRDRDQYRRGRALMLGVLAFVALGLAILLGVLVHWLSTLNS
jgi:hypothetical protein